jgi:ABC-type sugar transport system ATPase subunit
MSEKPLLRLEHITKSFSGVTVLDDIHLEVRPGEVHALVGENGAGKSTLVKIVAGAHRADRGRIFWKGRQIRIENPRQARQLGISIVNQEPMLVPQLSIGENIFLGRHPSRRAIFRWVRWRDIHERAEALLRRLGCRLDPKLLVGRLSIADQQLVEIARALASRAELIIMDEPTSPLSEPEAKQLFETIARLRAQGVSFIYISHRLKEIHEIADRVTVLRDGRCVVTGLIAEIPRGDLVRFMAGREVKGRSSGRSSRASLQEALRVEGLTSPGKFYDVSFCIRRGEILGLAGLVGAGRTELAEAIFGAAPPESGKVYLYGEPVNIKTPAAAVRLGMALVPDDRKVKGLVVGASVRFNVALAARQTRRRVFLGAAPEEELIGRLLRDLRFNQLDMEQPVIYLSGGNQQKVVLARWLLADPKVFILDEPTRGIDVGARAEIYNMVWQLADRGVAILLISSELDEILLLADRILVMRRGRIVGQMGRQEATEERIMRLAAGGE